MTNSIKCPRCGEEINIENLIQAGAKETVDKEVSAIKEQYEQVLAQAKHDTELLKVKSAQEKEKAIEEALNLQKQEFKAKEEKIKNAALEEQKEAYEELEKELQEKSNQLKEMN